MQSTILLLAITLGCIPSCRTPLERHVGLLISVFARAVGKVTGLLSLDHVVDDDRRSPVWASRSRRGNGWMGELHRRVVSTSS